MNCNGRNANVTANLSKQFICFQIEIDFEIKDLERFIVISSSMVENKSFGEHEILIKFKCCDFCDVKTGLFQDNYIPDTSEKLY